MSKETRRNERHELWVSLTEYWPALWKAAPGFMLVASVAAFVLLLQAFR